MRKTLLGIVAVLILGVGYLVSPFVAAWSIREAIRDGETAVLEQRIAWPSVRESLRRSLTAMADPLTPAVTRASTAPRKGLWARFKSYASRKAVDNLVDTYGNAEGLPQLFNYGAAYRSVVHGRPEERTLANLPRRVSEFWARVKRAEFKTLTAFELEIQDRHAADRHYIGLLELHGLSWTLTELHVRTTSPPEAVTADS